MVDQRSDGERAHNRADGVGLDDVAGIGDAEVVHDLQERAEVVGPAEVTDKECGRKDAGAENRTIREEGQRKKRDCSVASLPYDESDQQEDAENQQADGKGRVPSFRL